MRQVPIEQFKRNINKEIKDLPFTVTRRGKVLFYVMNHMVQDKIGIPALIKPHGSELNRAVEPKKAAKMPTGVVNDTKEASDKPTEIIKKKQKRTQSKTTFSTGKIPTVSEVINKLIKPEGKTQEHKIWVNPLLNTTLAPKT